jgi:hypothetical protein
MGFLEIFTVLPEIWTPLSPEASEASRVSKVSEVSELPTPPIKRMRLYQGKGAVSIAERSESGEPLGFINLGGCSELTLSLRVNQNKHSTIKDGRQETDYIFLDSQVT